MSEAQTAAVEHAGQVTPDAIMQLGLRSGARRRC